MEEFVTPRWVHVLPWAAAISVGALLGAAAYCFLYRDSVFLQHVVGPKTGLDAVRVTYPYALCLCAAVGVPVAMWFRLGPTSAMMAMGVGVVLTGLLVISLIGNFLGDSTGEARGWAVAFLIFIVPFVVIIHGAPIVALFACISVPVGALIVFVSGEMTAIRKGVSILELSHGGLRFALLVLLACAPAGTFIFMGGG
ncbi:MAG TPA: hypothetical protein VKY24_16645 [Reyranella sp.]|nr:hypothetical protein [Reyranella sp.]